jgi:hypothetical protein
MTFQPPRWDAGRAAALPARHRLRATGRRSTQRGLPQPGPAGDESPAVRDPRVPMHRGAYLARVPVPRTRPESSRSGAWLGDISMGDMNKSQQSSAAQVISDLVQVLRARE